MAWNEFSYGLLADVSAAYGAIGAEIHDIKPSAPEKSVPLTSAPGALGDFRNAWLSHFI